MRTVELQRMAEVLAKPVGLDLDVNDLRIILGCFRLASYMAEVDNEPYLEPDGKELKQRLEQLYSRLMEEVGPQDQAM